MPNPQLGYGQQSEARIDDVNRWMRTTPWYGELLRSWGQNPNSVKLSDWQRQTILRRAQADGVVVDQGSMEIDPSGNFNPIGHKLRNTLIVAGIAGATLATAGLAGAFSGAAGAGGAGAGGAGGAAGAAGGVLPSTTIGSGFIPGIAGGTGLAGAGAAGAGAAGAGLGAGAAGAAGGIGKTIAGAGGAAASSTPAWLRAVTAAIPGGIALATRPGAPDLSGGGPFGSDISGQISELLKLARDRVARTEPVHQAAIAMAQRMAPTGQSSPRMDAAIEATRQPTSPAGMQGPGVLEALQALVGRR